ncbi:MAG: phosphodiester glycosidase family protein [Actinobacteria bacterium]|nr:phosphodiester glycosidase family protein [Actinomycetota bacterium]
MRRIGLGTIVGAVALLLVAPSARAGDVVPAGYEIVATEQVAPGLTHTTIRRRAPDQVVHVGRVAPGSGLRLRAVLSNDEVSGEAPRLERTSSMCQRVRCLVAVNADFAPVGPNEPVGGMVVDGRVVRTPVPTHHQLVVPPDGTPTIDPLDVKAQLVPTDLRPLPLDGINRPRDDDQLVLYTPDFGPTTATNAFGVELVVELDDAHPLAANTTAVVRLVALQAAGSATIPRAGAVISGHGRGEAALRELWAKVESGAVPSEALLRVEAPSAAVQSVGGTPVLVREGRRWVPATGDGFVAGRHPRTMVGWTTDGEVLLVTVDGRQPGYSEGMSLAQAADLMVELGAVEALNLDGGGSTTFVVNGSVTNVPSDRLVRDGRGRDGVVPIPRRGDAVVGNVERPVVSAIAVVAGEAEPPPAPEVRLPRLKRGELRYVAAADPASNPNGSLPALVTTAPPSRAREAATALAVVMLLATSAAAGAVGARGSRSQSPGTRAARR